MSRWLRSALALLRPGLLLTVLPVAVVLVAAGPSILRSENTTLGCWILPNAAVSFASALDPVCPLDPYERIIRIDAEDKPVHRRADLLAALPRDGSPLVVTAARGSARRSVAIPIIDDSRELRVAQFLIATALSGVLVALGLSLRLRRESPAATPIAVLCATSAIFLVATIARSSTPILDLSWILAQGLLAAALCHLALVYPRERRLAERAPGIVTLLYAGAFALTAAEWVGFRHHNDALWEIADRTAATWIVAATGALGVSSLLALHETSSVRERVQARILLMASAVAIALLAILAMDPGGALPLAPRRTVAIGLIGFLVLLTYLVSRFGLLDVPLAVRWTAAHVVYATIVSALAYGAFYIVAAAGATSPPTMDPAILYAGVFGALVLLEGLRRFSWATTERWVTPWAPKLETLRSEGVGEISRADSPDAVASLLATTVRDGVDARGVAVFLPLGEAGWRLGAAAGTLDLSPELPKLAGALTAERAVQSGRVDIVDLGQAAGRDAPRIQALRRAGIGLTAVLPGARAFAGVLLANLGRRPRLLSSDHLSFVEQLCAQSALALDNLHLQYHLLLSARMAAVGHAAAGLAHDLGRPLGEIFLEARRDGANSPMRPDAAAIASLASECLEQLQRFVAEGKEATGPPGAPAALGLVLEAACDRAARLHPGSRPVLRLPPHLPHVSDPGSVQRVVENLLENAMHWSDPDAPVELYARTDERRIVLQVIDHGPGLSPEARARAFEPFFSERGGSGLGLTICKHIVEGLGGTIALDSTAVGTRFTVALPRESS